MGLQLIRLCIAQPRLGASPKYRGVVAQLVEHLHGMQGVVGSSPISSTTNFERFSMADIAQLVRALVCGTKCRRFESGYPPH